MNWQTGLPTVPGEYLVDLGPGRRKATLWWSSDSVDWREGAVLTRVRRWLGPLPA